MRIVALSLLLALSALGSGCGLFMERARIDRLPATDAEWSRPLDELRRDYPDLVKYGGYGSVWGRRFDAEAGDPPMSEVTALLGPPESARPSWWNLKGLIAVGPVPVGLVLVLVQPEAVWTWRKGRYRIDAVVDHFTIAGPLGLGEPELWYLDIEPLDGAPARPVRQERQDERPPLPPEEQLAARSRAPRVLWLPPQGLEIVETRPRGKAAPPEVAVRPIPIEIRATCTDFSNAYLFETGRSYRTRMTRGDRPPGEGIIADPGPH